MRHSIKSSDDDIRVNTPGTTSVVTTDKESARQYTPGPSNRATVQSPVHGASSTSGGTLTIMTPSTTESDAGGILYSTSGQNTPTGTSGVPGASRLRDWLMATREDAAESAQYPSSSSPYTGNSVQEVYGHNELSLSPWAGQPCTLEANKSWKCLIHPQSKGDEDNAIAKLNAMVKDKDVRRPSREMIEQVSKDLATERLRSQADDFMLRVGVSDKQQRMKAVEYALDAGQRSLRRYEDFFKRKKRSVSDTLVSAYEDLMDTLGSTTDGGMGACLSGHFIPVWMPFDPALSLRPFAPYACLTVHTRANKHIRAIAESKMYDLSYSSRRSPADFDRVLKVVSSQNADHGDAVESSWAREHMLPAMGWEELDRWQYFDGPEPMKGDGSWPTDLFHFMPYWEKALSGDTAHPGSN